MRSAELRAAIERPAHAAGLTLEPGLVEMLLHELGADNGSSGTGIGVAALYDPGALPLLSHAPQTTWEHRDGRTLTVAGYQATGGIRGAVATTAEDTFQEFDPAGQQAAQRVRQLITGFVVLVLSLTGGGIALYKSYFTPPQPAPAPS
jgi:hypothetical protein